MKQWVHIVRNLNVVEIVCEAVGTHCKKSQCCGDSL